MGTIVSFSGDVTIKNATEFDNILGGIEYERIDHSWILGQAKVDGGRVIRNSVNLTNNVDHPDIIDLDHGTHGVIGPRTDWFTIQNVKFFRFSNENGGALSDCSHCFHPAATDSGARTYFTKNLTFSSDSTRWIHHQFPYNGIFNDLDGSLTNLGANSWAVPTFKHI